MLTHRKRQKYKKVIFLYPPSHRLILSMCCRVISPSMIFANVLFQITSTYGVTLNSSMAEFLFLLDSNNNWSKYKLLLNTTQLAYLYDSEVVNIFAFVLLSALFYHPLAPFWQSLIAVCIGRPIHCNHYVGHYSGFSAISRSILNRFAPFTGIVVCQKNTSPCNF